MTAEASVERDVQCARCGSSMDWEDCPSCGGDGRYEDDDCGEIIERICGDCEGDGGRWWCISSADYCEGNPREGREGVSRHTEEWFEIPAPEEGP